MFPIGDGYCRLHMEHLRSRSRCLSATPLIAIAFALSSPVAYRNARGEGGSFDDAMHRAYGALRTCGAVVFNLSHLIALLWLVTRFLGWLFL